MKTFNVFKQACLVFACGAVFGGANAQLLYANSAGSDMASFKLDGTQVSTYTQDKGNGRGVVVVGNTIYYTVANSSSIYTRRVSDNVDTGIAFSIAGSSGLQAISYDGTNFWVGDYSGTNNAYLVSAADGSLLKTVSLTGSEGYYDGLEYFNGKLIANRYDGGYARAGGNQYDVYDLNGSLLQAAFINTNGHGNGTGIAFDGTNFYVSDIFNNRISKWDGTTGSFIDSITLGGNHQAIEDLSVDFAGRVDTCGGPNQPPCDIPGVPEPETYALMLAGLGLVGWMSRRSRA
jgi:hypothetical protein